VKYDPGDLRVRKPNVDPEESQSDQVELSQEDSERSEDQIPRVLKCVSALLGIGMLIGLTSDDEAYAGVAFLFIIVYATYQMTLESLRPRVAYYGTTLILWALLALGADQYAWWPGWIDGDLLIFVAVVAFVSDGNLLILLLFRAIGKAIAAEYTPDTKYELETKIGKMHTGFTEFTEKLNDGELSIEEFKLEVRRLVAYPDDGLGATVAEIKKAAREAEARLSRR
jgi:hypothetical protein